VRRNFESERFRSFEIDDQSLVGQRPFHCVWSGKLEELSLWRPDRK
jgi:hypothetical protein